MTSSGKTPKPRQRSDAEQVLQVLTDFCDSLQPGDLVPTYHDLMRRFDASERAVRWALDELRRQGKIVRRQGARTYVAEPQKRAALTSPYSQGNAVTAGTPLETSVGATETRTVITIAIPDHAVFDQAITLLVEQAKNEDLSLMCHVLPEALENISQLPQIAHAPLGFILFRRDLLPLAEQLYAAGHRVVLMGTPYADVTPGVPVIYGDQEYGGYLATSHLIELGHRRLAFCAFADCEKTLRWQGHHRAIREAARRGIPVEVRFLDIEEVRTWKENPAPGEAIFRDEAAPTGVVVWNDHEAATLMGQLNRLGLRIPQDVSIVGYDNLREGQLLHPALTTVHSPMEQQLQAALNLLMRSNPPSAPYQLVVLPTLTIRDSTSKPAV